MDLHTLVVSIMSKEGGKLNCNEPKAVKGNQSDLLLGEVVDWGMVLVAVVAKIVGARCPEVFELALSISSSEPVKLYVR